MDLENLTFGFAALTNWLSVIGCLGWLLVISYLLLYVITS